MSTENPAEGFKTAGAEGPEPTEEEVRTALSAETRYTNKRIMALGWLLMAMTGLVGYAILGALSISYSDPAHLLVGSYAMAAFCAFAILKTAAHMSSASLAYRLLDRVGLAPSSTMGEIRRELVEKNQHRADGGTVSVHPTEQALVEQAAEQSDTFDADDLRVERGDER